MSDYAWVNDQHDRFKELATASGASVSSFIEPLRLMQPGGWAEDRSVIAAWLKKLPKPVGIFACYDLRGQQVLDACRAIGLTIPDDVAVVGVDDDAVRCSLSDPPLSSVAPNTRRVGYQAAELLDRMMTGEKIEPGMRLVAPIGVSARRSTDALAVPDPEVAAAVRYIRDHYSSPMTVDDILEHVSLSRRSLESRFVSHIGRTPHAEILRCRLERAKQLLVETDLPIKTIANRVGVGTPEYLSVLFQRAFNTTPSAFRTAPSK
ncbi:MAG: substrate-binding domain-containing protein [Tepidisphaeraceae bacterium]